MLSPEIFARYDQPVPRYTSYPTAPHFTEAVDAATHARWLAEIPEGDSLSLYAHIPFCDTMCWFCGCHTKIVNRYEPISAYLDHMTAEVERVAETLGKHHRASHVHWGGGTPTSLAPEDILRLTDSLRAHFDFDETSEFAVEIDPRGVGDDTIAALGQAGVTRASLGVQDFSPRVQQAVNRIQPFDETKRVIDGLRGVGIAEINVDIMYGLPHQGTDEVLATAEKVLELEPARLALFGYAHVPWMKTHQKMIDEAALPSTEERWRQAGAARAFLEDHGFVTIGLDHFARADDPMAVALKSGALHRNFQGYTTDRADTLVGFGASSISSLPAGYVQNSPQINLYRRALDEGHLPTARGVELSADDRLRRALIERLMCDLEVDLGKICAQHGMTTDVLADARPKLEKLAADGLIELDGDRLTVTPDGRLLVRCVGAAFDAYFEVAEGKHSKAV
jgi:oxygen-independent coproporphyrinogen-3 oxidase